MYGVDVNQRRDSRLQFFSRFQTFHLDLCGILDAREICLNLLAAGLTIPLLARPAATDQIVVNDFLDLAAHYCSARLEKLHLLMLLDICFRHTFILVQPRFISPAQKIAESFDNTATFWDNVGDATLINLPSEGQRAAICSKLRLLP